MGVTGLLMVVFVVAHMLGNLSTFGGAAGLNAYAEHLRAFPPMLWAFRGVMALAIMLHVLFGITLYLQNKAARPVDYAVKKDQRTSFSAQTMIWTGLLLGTFVVLHLLHFTLHLGNPQWNEMLDAAGRFDVFQMVSSSLSNAGIALFYLASMVILLLHLLHGVQSFFQSLGLTNENTFCTINAGGKLVAFVAALGFILIPLSILFGIVK
jgi:succinate dehydrogenase / fumarate reductase cytochrome b subunit